MSQSTAYPTVSELTQQIQDSLECDFSRVIVCGEVSSFHHHRSGHWYLTLKDQKAQIAAVVWRSTAARQKIAMQDGIEVVVRGRITVYAPRGNYQLIVDRIDPVGEGAYRAAFQKLHRKLEQEGLFAPERKRELPPLPRRVAVITSPSGAAIRDFLQVATRRWQGSEILIIPTRVQGPEAGVQLAAAVDLAQHLRPAPDVIVVTRGGGSIEDLWEFNSEELVRAIARCEIPVVSGVGHEIDVTLCDLVADLRALTPSEAAERVFPDQQALLRGLASLQQQMQAHLRRRWETARESLQRLADSRVLKQPLAPLRDRAQQLDDYSQRLDQNMVRWQTRQRDRVSSLAAQLEGLSPLNVLARGYSLTFHEDGKPVRDARQVVTDQELTTRLSHGSVVSRVTSILPYDSPPS